MHQMTRGPDELAFEQHLRSVNPGLSNASRSPQSRPASRTSLASQGSVTSHLSHYYPEGDERPLPSISVTGDAYGLGHVQW